MMQKYFIFFIVMINLAVTGIFTTFQSVNLFYTLKEKIAPETEVGQMIHKVETKLARINLDHERLTNRVIHSVKLPF
jgi:hypothetical protein